MGVLFQIRKARRRSRVPVQECQRGDSSSREYFMLPGSMRNSLVLPGSSRSCRGEREVHGSRTVVVSAAVPTKAHLQK